MSNDYVDKVSAVGTIYDIHVPNGAITRAKLDADLQEKTDAVSDLKSAVGVLEPAATSGDVGKALIAKTVSGGKVTEYEFGEAVTLDDTLTQAGEAADAKATGDALAVKITEPETDGTSGQVLTTNGNGGRSWTTIPTATDAQVKTAVDEWLDDHPEATTTVQDGSITTAKLAEWTVPFVYPEQFGAVGDGETDDAPAIQDAIDYCIETGKKLVFMPKTYGVIPYQQDKSVVIYNDTYYALLIKGSIDIDFNGCKIQLLENAISDFCVISIRDTANVTVQNGTIIGDRATFTVSGDNSQLLDIFDSKNVHLNNIIMQDSKGDCFGHSGVQHGQPYVRREFSDFYMGNLIENCVMRHSVRHGMTFSKGRGVTFSNCRIENVQPEGQISWNGNAVDMEPYYGYGSIFDVRFDNCSMTDNVGGPYIQHADSVRFTNCYLQGVGFRVAVNCMVENCFSLGGMSANSSTITFDGCIADGGIYITNNEDAITETGTTPEIVIRNNTCRKIEFNSVGSAYAVKNIIIENNTITGSTAQIYLTGKSGTDVIIGEAIIANNRVMCTSASEYYQSGFLLLSTKDIKNVFIRNNFLAYDMIKVSLASFVVEANGVEHFRFIGNTIQRKYEQENVEYVSVISNVIKLKDVGVAMINGNTINPDNTVFGTMSMAMILAETSSGGTNVQAIVTNNYAKGVTDITSTPGAVNMLVDVNNVLDNVAPYQSASGVSF